MSNPLQINSNRVFKFSGLGAVTKILEYLKEMSFIRSNEDTEREKKNMTVCEKT